MNLGCEWQHFRLLPGKVRVRVPGDSPDCCNNGRRCRDHRLHSIAESNMSSNKPEYQKQYFARWYKDNRAAQIAAVCKRRDKISKENQQKIIAYLKQHPCVDCGETDIVVLQFDHVRGKKRTEIGKMISYSWESILIEIAKCEVRCANDHLRKTAKQQGFYRTKVIGVSFNA